MESETVPINTNAEASNQTLTGIEPGDRTNWRSIALSFAIHLSLLIAIGLVWTSRTIGGGAEEGLRRVEIVLASADEEAEYFDESDQIAADAAENADSANVMKEALPDDAPPIDVSQMVNEVVPLDMPLPGINSSEMARVENRTNAAMEATLTEEQKKMLAAESAAFQARLPKGPPTTIQVFGSGELTGRKFVFVLDRSKSMGGQGLNVIRAAVDELSTAVNSLQDYHQFQILGYHHSTVAMSHRALLDATEENKKGVAEFIDGLAAFGGTQHDIALSTALSMDPDVVVLLTDGGLPELNDSDLARVRRMADGAQIHCIQFGSGVQQGSETFMKKLAGQNQGTYRYINVNEWKR